MKKFLAVVFFCLPAFGQSAYSGLGLYSGSAAYGSFLSGGAPLTYSARTDNCVTGAESGCISGTTAGKAGSALIFQAGTSDPVPFYRLDTDTTPGNCVSYTPPYHADCAVAGVPFIDPDFGAYEIFLTDQTTKTNTTVHIVSSGGGEFDAFGIGLPNDVLYAWQNTGSVAFLAHVLEANFLAHTCATSKCVVLSNVVGSPCTPTPGVYTGSGICTQTQISNGAIALSRNVSDTPNTLYEANLPIVVKTTFITGSNMGVNDSVTRVAHVNFSSDSSGVTPCHVWPSDYVSLWNGVFKMSDGGAVTVGSSGGGSYQTIWEQVGGSSTSGAPQTVTNDVFIMPVNNITTPLNIANFMFQASAGTTSGTEPNWSSLCAAQGSTCTDGSVTWTNIGKVAGQGPGFDVVHFDPLRGCSRINSRLMKIYRGTNEGVNWPSTGTADPAGQIVTDDAVICFRMGGTNCGTGGTVNLTDKFTLHAADQKFDSRYGAMGPTGAGALNKNYAGGGGSWPEMSSAPNGSCTVPIAYTAYSHWPDPTWVSGANYSSGVYATSPADRNYYKLTTSTYVSTPSTVDPSSDPTNWNLAAAYCYNYAVDWYTNIVRPILEIGPNYGGDTHSAEGYALDYRGGSYYSHYYYQPNCQTGTGGCPYVGSPNPGVRSLSAALPSDGHPSSRNVGVADLQPIFDPTTSVPAWGGVGMTLLCGGGTNASGYCAAGYNEEIAYNPNGLSRSSIVSISGNGTTATTVTSSSLSAVVGEPLLITGTTNYNSVYTLLTVNNSTNTYTFSATATATETVGAATIQAFYRYGHNFNTGSNAGFGVQNAIGVISKDGKMLAYTSDFMNTRGDFVTGSATCVSPLRAQYQPGANQLVTYLDSILPIGHNASINIFQAVGLYSGTFPSGSYVLSGTGNEGATIPIWDTSCSTAGSYCTTDGTNNPATGHPLDGNVLWQNLGRNSCRGDIGLMDVTSAHPAP